MSMSTNMNMWIQDMSMSTSMSTRAQQDSRALSKLPSKYAEHVSRACGKPITLARYGAQAFRAKRSTSKPMSLASHVAQVWQAKEDVQDTSTHAMIEQEDVPIAKVS